jgi:hypothetical protein
MGTPAASSTTDPTAERRAAAQTSPVGVVWCRQVDNEAESPGYTTVPEEFPGHRETLDTIRIVGNLTVNVADTHDYWDPDPSQPLSYYPNLFLYPAANGRYTCVGRMFLSTEDRPRLGMKTLVLDTQQLLATGEFGATVLRWHASMGGPRRETRPPPAPDPALYSVVGEGFLFHRGSTDPVLLVASDQWEATMQAILDLVRVLPASLVALGAILAFPYFLPQPKTNLHEFTEQIPLSLALMRVARGEAAGDRHAKRIQSWESASVTVRDLTDGIPASGGRSKESSPLVLQFVRDRQEAKLVPIRQRVDLVETARLRAHLSDPERQGGRDRRKEIWRIGTAMESAALLLQRARGRHVPVTAETAKRAQEYLQARVPTAAGEPAPEDAVVRVPPTPSALTADAPPPGKQLPPWLNRPGDSVPAPRTGRPEVVPMSVSDDPTLHPSETPPVGSVPPPVVPPTLTSAPAPSPAPATPFPSATPAPAVSPAPPARSSVPASPAASPPLAPPATERAPPPPPPPGAPAVVPVVPPSASPVAPGPSATEIDRMIQERVGQTRTQFAEELRRSTADLEHRLTAQWSEAAGRKGEVDDTFRLGLERRLSEAQSAQQTTTDTFRIELDKRFEAAETRLRAAVATAIGPEVDKRLQTSLEPKVAEALGKVRDDQRGVVEAHRQRVADEADRTNAELRERVERTEEELRTSLSAQLDLHLREAADRELSVREELEARLKETIQKRLDEVEAKRVRDQKEGDQRLAILVDGRTREVSDRLQKTVADQQARLSGAVDGRVGESEGRLYQKFEGRANELQTANLQAIADLQVRMQGHFDEKLREGLDREREKYLELLARLKAEVEGSFARASDPAKFEPIVRERIARTIDAFRAETQRMVDTRVGEAEARLAEMPADGLQRLEQVEQVLAEREALLEQLETRIRGELDELDHRTQVLSDRLVPVVRKAWLKIAEIQKASPGAASATSDAELQTVRRDLHREVRRLEAELQEKTAEIRDRMETSIANQGRVWLTLVRQLSQLTDDRRALDRGKVDRSSDTAWSEADEKDPLAGLGPSVPRSSSRGSTAPTVDPALSDDDPLGADDPPADRRRPARRR